MSIPTLQESDIERLVGRRNVRRGWEYYDDGALVETFRQESLLKATCIGSSRDPYFVQARFTDNNEMESRCSCPVGQSGNCKHVAALLIAWMERPQAFLAAASWESVLDQCNRGELLSIVKRLLAERPEMRRLAEAAVKEQSRPAEETAKTVESYRGKVADLVTATPATPAAAAHLAEQLQHIKEVADDWDQQREPADAAALYAAIVDRLSEHPELFAPQQTELVALLYDCVEMLSLCLDQLRDDDSARQAVLHTLLSLYRFETTFPGTGVSLDLAHLLLSHASRAERELLADWARTALQTTPSQADRRALGGFLLVLLGARAEEAEVFDICRRAGRIFDLVRRLMLQGRLPEALTEAQQAGDFDLLAIADLLARCQQADTARRLVAQRAESSATPELRKWLEDEQTRRTELQGLLDLSGKLFRLRPSLALYCQVRETARQLGQWDVLRPRLLDLVQRLGRLPLLVRIHLEEHDLDQAMEIVEREQMAMEEGGLALRVARAAERPRPGEAAAIYRGIVERLIARRGRDNYLDALGYLIRVRTLMKRNGEVRQWHAYWNDLCHRCRPLVLLGQELDAAQRHKLGL